MRRLVGVAVVVAAVLPASAFAGTSIRAVDSGSFPSVRVTYVAPVGSAAPVLLENGRPVSDYHAVNLGQTKSIELALDRSQSMRGKPLANALAAAERFAASAGADDHVGVVGFGRSAIALTRVASSPAEAHDAITSIAVDARSGTALYDAIVLAASRLAADQRPGRAIVVVTDGQDVSSTHSLGEAVAAAHAAKAAIYAIGIAGPDFTSDALKELASSTGGSYREASSSRQLAQTYAALSGELSRTWQLSYLTSARPGDVVRLVARGHGTTATLVNTFPGSSDVAAQGPSGLIPAVAYGSSGTALIGLVVGGIILLSGFFWLASQRESRLRRRIEPHLTGSTAKSGAAQRRANGAETRAKLADAIEATFANFKQFRRLAQLIERADLPLRPGELLAMSIGAAFAAGLITAVLGFPTLLILVVMAFGFALPIAYVGWKARGRLHRFENQLPDMLITMAASLKAGHSFRQGIQSVVEEGAEPASEEFQRVLAETQLGKPMDEALSNMAERVNSANFSFVITAVTIQRQIGGSLSGLFDMVADTVRQRQQFARKVKSLTAMGRMSAYVLVALPFFMAGLTTLMSPRYMSPLWHTGVGQTMVASGLVMITIGSLILKKIASFRG